MKRHRKVASFFHKFEGRVDGIVSRIAFGRIGKVNNCFAEHYARFGIAHSVNSIKTSLRKQHSVRIGKTNILAGRNYQSPGNKFEVFTTCKHTRKPIYSGIGIASSDTLDKRRNNIVMHLAIFIIHCKIFLKTLHYNLIVDNYLVGRFGIDNYL